MGCNNNCDKHAADLCERRRLLTEQFDAFWPKELSFPPAMPWVVGLRIPRTRLQSMATLYLCGQVSPVESGEVSLLGMEDSENAANDLVNSWGWIVNLVVRAIGLGLTGGSVTVTHDPRVQEVEARGRRQQEGADPDTDLDTDRDGGNGVWNPPGDDPCDDPLVWC